MLHKTEQSIFFNIKKNDIHKYFKNYLYNQGSDLQ